MPLSFQDPFSPHAGAAEQGGVTIKEMDINAIVDRYPADLHEQIKDIVEALEIFDLTEEDISIVLSLCGFDKKIAVVLGHSLMLERMVKKVFTHELQRLKSLQKRRSLKPGSYENIERRIKLLSEQLCSIKKARESLSPDKNSNESDRAP